MAYMRMRTNTWYEYNPLEKGRIVEVPDEVAAAWKKDLLATEAKADEYEAQLKLDQAAARAKLEEAEQQGAGSNALLRENVEALEAEDSSATRSARTAK